MNPISRDEGRLKGYSEASLDRLDAKRKPRGKAPDAGRPDVPADLSRAEREIWEAAISALEHRGTLTPGDGPALRLFAQLSAERDEERKNMESEGRVIVTQRLDSHGHGIVVRTTNPRLRIVRDLEKQLVSLLRELGLTPLRRHQVQKATGGTATDLTIEDLLDFSIVKGQNNGKGN
jgi:P27 family predicted phage terminase small subunit